MKLIEYIKGWNTAAKLKTITIVILAISIGLYPNYFDAEIWTNVEFSLLYFTIGVYLMASIIGFLSIRLRAIIFKEEFQLPSWNANVFLRINRLSLIQFQGYLLSIMGVIILGINLLEGSEIKQIGIFMIAGAVGMFTVLKLVHSTTKKNIDLKSLETFNED